MASSSSDSSLSGLALARQHYASGNFLQARQTIESVLRADPNNLDALLLAAELYRLENPQVALKVYARVAQLAPQRPETPAGLAWLYHDQGDVARCDQCLDAVIDLDPEYLRTRYYSDMAAARAALAQGESARDKRVDFYDSIAAAYQRALERYPVSPLVAFNLARILFVLGEPELAGKAYEHCLKLDPEMSEACAGMAEVAFVLEQYEQAVDWCKLLEGRTWRVMGDANDPHWMAARAAAGDLSLAHAYLVQAKSHLWVGQFDAVGQSIRRAAEMEPWNSGDVYRDLLNEHVKLGTALLENGQQPDAVRVLEAGRELADRVKYHELFLWLAEAYLAQALVCQEARERAQAEAWLARAREIAHKPPAPVPAEASAAWSDLKARLTSGDTGRLFGFLRR